MYPADAQRVCYFMLGCVNHETWGSNSTIWITPWRSAQAEMDTEEVPKPVVLIYALLLKHQVYHLMFWGSPNSGIGMPYSYLLVPKTETCKDIFHAYPPITNPAPSWDYSDILLKVMEASFEPLVKLHAYTRKHPWWQGIASELHRHGQTSWLHFSTGIK